MLSRREWVKWILSAPAVVGLAGTSLAQTGAQTGGKVSQEAAKYQDAPNNGQICGMCKYFIPPGGQAGSGMMGGPRGPGMMTQAGTCQVVEGSISPRGWCVLYAPIGS